MKTKKKSRSPHSKAPVDAQKNVHVPTAKKAPKTLENMRLKDATFLSLSNPDEVLDIHCFIINSFPLPLTMTSLHPIFVESILLIS